MKTGLTLTDRATGKALISNVKMAETAWERTVGLLNRASLAPGEGLLLPQTPSIHTFFMRFAIDAVFLSKDHEILKISPAPPWRLRLCLGASQTLELPLGEAERIGLKVGQRVDFSEPANA